MAASGTASGLDPGKAEIERERGAERGGGRGTDQPGLRQRVAQQSLQRRAAEPERRADREGEHRARQADLDHDDIGESGRADQQRRSGEERRGLR